MGNKDIHVGIVGAGKIGNRHLQGLNNIKFNVNVTLRLRVILKY